MINPTKLRRSENVLVGSVFTKRVYDFLDSLLDTTNSNTPSTVSSGQGVSVNQSGNNYEINALIAGITEGKSISITNNGLGNYTISTEIKPGDVTLIDYSLSPYTVFGKYTIIQADATNGDIVINLPSLDVGVYCCVIRTDGTANSIYVNSSDGIVGDSSVLISTQYESIEFIGGVNEYLII